MIPLALLALSACAPPIDGTWMFTIGVTPDTGAECQTTLIHNLVGAYPPVEAGADPAWVTNATAEVSPELVFGRVETTGDGAAVLVLGDRALPGAREAEGWAFWWDTATSGEDRDTHTTGYAWSDVWNTRSTLRVSGSFAAEGFSGRHETESEDRATWSESDTWSVEAAATVTDTGRIPSADYLLRADGAGGEVAATNGREAFDCGADGCALTVTTTCARIYTIEGVPTDFTPEDADWVAGAGQAAGG